MTTAEIEQIKHTSSWLNSLATAVATAGAVGPLIALIAGSLPGTSRIEVLLTMNLICFGLALILHRLGNELLGEIRP